MARLVTHATSFRTKLYRRSCRYYAGIVKNTPYSHMAISLLGCVYTETLTGAEHCTQDVAVSKQQGRRFEPSMTEVTHCGAASAEHCSQKV